MTEFSFADACGEQIISSYGVRTSDNRPSLIALTGLTEIEYIGPSFCGGFTIWASAGGAVDLSALTVVTLNPQTPYDHVFRASGEGSVVSLSSLAALDSGLALYAETGGTIEFPTVEEIYGTLSVYSGSELTFPVATLLGALALNVGGVLDLPQITSITNCTIYLSDIGQLHPPEVTSMANSNVTLNGSAVLDAPKLTAMTGVADATRYISLGESSQFDAPLLSSLVNVSTAPAADLNARFTAHGTLDPHLAGRFSFELAPSRVVGKALAGKGDLALNGPLLTALDLALDLAGNRLVAKVAATANPATVWRCIWMNRRLPRWDMDWTDASRRMAC